MRHRPLEDNPQRYCLISPLSFAPTFAMLNFPHNGDDRTVRVRVYLQGFYSNGCSDGMVEVQVGL